MALSDSIREKIKKDTEDKKGIKSGAYSNETSGSTYRSQSNKSSSNLSNHIRERVAMDVAFKNMGNSDYLNDFQYGRYLKDSVDDNYINSVLSDWNKYATDVNTAVKGLNWNTATSGEYDSIFDSGDDIRDRAIASMYHLYQNKDNMDANRYKEVYSYLDSIINTQPDTMSWYSGAKDVYSKFKSQEEYDKALEYYNQWGKYQDEEDFEEYKTKGASVSNPSWDDSKAPVEIFGWKPFGDGSDVINMVAFAEANKDKAELASVQAARSGVPLDEETKLVNAINLYMTDEEKGIYNYLIGKGETQKASEYLESLKDTFTQREAGRIVEQVDSTALEAVFSAIAGVDSFVSGVKNLDNYILGTESDPTTSFQYAHQAMSSNNKNVWKFANDLTYTTGNMLPSILVGSITGGVGGAVTMGTSATGNAYAEMRNLGYNEWQSRGYATLVGASEGTLSYLLGGIGKLGGGGKGIFQTAASQLIPKFDKALARVAIQLGGNILDEGLEEGIQTVLEPAFKALMTGEDFEAPEWEDVFYSALLGAVSAGFLEGVPAVVETSAQSRQAGKIYGSDPQALVTEALEINPENAHAQRMQARLDNGDKLSGYQLNRLVQQNEATLTAQDMSSIQSAAESRLSELGETGDVGAIAKALAKQAAGEKLTRAEQKIISDSKYGQRVANELNPENIKSGDYSSEWAQKLDTNRINVDEYSRLVEAAQLPQETTEIAGDKVAAEAPKAAQVAQAAPVEAPAATIRESRTVENGATGKESLQVTEESPVIGVETNSSIEGKTFQKSTGNELQVKMFASVGGKDTTVASESGENISLSDVSWGNESEALVMQSIPAIDHIDTYGANTILHAYRSGDNNVPAASFVSGAAHVFKSGFFNGKPLDEYTSKLTPNQVDLIYNAGREAAAEHYRAEQEKVDKKNKAAAEKDSTAAKKGGVFYEYDGKTIDQRNDGKHKTPTQDQRVAIDFTKRMAKRFGSTVYFYESYVDENGNRVYKAQDGTIKKARGGFYDPKDGSIHIDLNGDHILFTVSHELVHFIKDWSPKQFKKMADLVMEGFNRQGLSVEELIANKQKEYAEDGIKLTEDQAFEEVVAASLEDIMSDGRVMELMQKLESEDKSLGAKVKKFFQDIGNMIRKAIDTYKGSLPDSAEGRLIRQMEDIYFQLQEAFAEGVYDAGESFRNAENTTNEGGVRYKPGYTNGSVDGGYNFTKPFAEQLQDYLDRNFPQDETFIVGPTPDNLLKIGLAKLPITMDRTHVSYALEGTYPGSIDRKQDHAMSKDDLANILEKIRNPVAIIQDRQIWQKKASGYSVDVLIDMEINGKKVLVPVNINQRAYANKTEYDSNKITTAHGDINAVERLVNALNEHSEDNIAVFYINKEKANEFLQPTGHPISSTAAKLDGFVARVTDKGSNVKMRISTALESRQFKDWFGDWQKRPDEASKIVNSDGTPKVMYHGSSAKFTIFDKKKARRSGQYGKGFYFTDSQSHAGTYGQLYSVFLNIRNPLEHGKDQVSRAQVRKFLETVAENDDYSIDNYGSYDVDSILQNIMGKNTSKDAFQLIQDVNVTAIGDMVEAVELFNKVNGTQYDGIVAATETVAFYPEQIKSATDNIGTFDGGNPDIRYSIGSKTDGAVQALLEKENEALREDVAQLKDLLKLQGKETHGTKFTPSSVESAARYLKKNAGAKGDTKALTKLLNSFYEYIATEKELTWDGVREQAKPIAQWLMDHREHTRSDYAQEVLDMIHGNRVYLDEAQMAEAAYRFGNYNDFRKALAGVITLSKNAEMSLDSWWHEMAGMYPDVFNETTTASDMPGELFDIVNRLRNENSSALEYEHNRRWIEQDLIRDVYDSYWRVSNLRTVADRYAAQMNRLKSQHAQRISNMKAETQKKIEQLKEQHKAEVQVYRNAFRQSLQEQMKELSTKYQETRKKDVDNRHKTIMRQKIRKTIRDLNKILNHGDKKRNVKEDMKDFVAEALAAAEVLFTDNYTNEDIVRNGFGAELSKEEAKYLEEAREIMEELSNLPVGGFDAWQARQEAEEQLKSKLAYRMSKLKDAFFRERQRLNKTEVSQVLGNLADAYAKLETSEYAYVNGAYHESVYQYLKMLQEDVGGAKIKDMTLGQLEELHKAYTMVLTTVQNANKAFVASKNVDQLVEKLVAEFGGRKMPKKKVGAIVRNISNMTGWDYEKLYYALDRIGSDTLTELFTNLANSENIVMADVIEAKQEQERIVEEYKYNTWKVDHKIDKDFVDNTGKVFRMTLGELMSLYAYSRRENAWNHIEYGGFVFGKAALTDVDPVTTYKLTKEQCEAIINTLTDEQKKFTEEMQTYLSDVMGAKGNEVSMLLYGIEMFGEKNYFPIHISGEFKANAKESRAKEEAGFSSMTNAGFTQAQNKEAKAPFVMESFMDVWADHVNEMSRYHGTVPALEDIRKVMNYSYYSDSYQDSMSVQAIMENKFGKQAVQYFNDLYQEANSGAITDKLQKGSHKLLSMFRKNSVAYSLSVLIQQPSSVVRAYALIPKKYFRGIRGLGALPIGFAQAATSKWTKSYKNAYAEMLKYAPGVTLAKEIGGFDTASGNSIRSYLLDTDKGFFKKMKTETAIGKVSAVANLVDDNFIANLPNVADKVAWIEIWNACKRETVATHKTLTTNSDAFMEQVGKRFTEVIRATQVYDSIFAKSPMLKSKNLAVQYLVSFMNEPNTTANMVESAVRDFTRGEVGSGFSKATAVVRAIFFTCVLKSIIYAMRDDDEDETYIEKYTESLVNNLLNDITVFNYIPIVRDVWSFAQGYDVERPDMAIVSDAISALTNVVNNFGKDTFDMTEEELVAWDKKVAEANWKLADSVCAFFGIPIKNVRREIDGLMDHARIAHKNSGKTTWMSIKNAVNQAIADASPAFAKPETKSNTDKLYDAIVSGDTVYVNRLKGSYKDQNAINNAIRKGLRENDPRIREAAISWNANELDEYMRIAREIIAEKHFVQDDVVMAIRAEASALEPDEKSSSSSKAKGLFTEKKFAEAILQGDAAMANAIKTDIIQTAMKNGKTAEDAEEDFASDARSEFRGMFVAGKLSKSDAIKALKVYCPAKDGPLNDNDIYWIIREWEYEKVNGFSDGYRKYNDFYGAVETGRDLSAVISKYTSHGVKKETLASEITSHFKPLYKEMSRSQMATLKKYLLNAYVQLGYDRSKKSKDIDKWLED